jgi:hypothetical protein
VTRYGDTQERRIEELEAALREVIGSCAPPVEALLMVHGDGKWIAPATVEGLLGAAQALRKNVAVLRDSPPTETENA